MMEGHTGGVQTILAIQVLIYMDAIFTLQSVFGEMCNSITSVNQMSNSIGIQIQKKVQLLLNGFEHFI